MNWAFDKTTVRAAAHGRWPEILVLLGVPRDLLDGRHHPCPFCGGRDRFRFTNHNGDGLWICGGCGEGRAQDGFAFVMHWNAEPRFHEALRAVAKALEGCLEQRAPRASSGAPTTEARTPIGLWDQAKPIVAGDPASTYLLGRGLNLPTFPPALRFAPVLRYVDGDGKRDYPGMLAAVTGPEGDLRAVHRTYIARVGKAPVREPKKLLGKIGDGAAIRLFPATDALAVAEGIETALAVHLMTGWPVWSLICSGGVEKFRPPACVTRLLIAGDNDLNFVGQAAAYTLARRLSGKMRLLVALPPTVGRDWLDVLNDGGRIENALRLVDRAPELCSARRAP